MPRPPRCLWCSSCGALHLAGARRSCGGHQESRGGRRTVASTGRPSGGGPHAAAGSRVGPASANPPTRSPTDADATAATVAAHPPSTRCATATATSSNAATSSSSSGVAGPPATTSTPPTTGCRRLARRHHLVPQLSRRALILRRWADGDVADLDVVGLLDGEGDSARHGVRADAGGHPVLQLFPDVRVIDVVDELGADEAR